MPSKIVSVGRRPKRKEASIENAVCRWAFRVHGIKSRKMNGVGFNSWPDRMFLLPRLPLLIEFKREGEEPTPLQDDTHKWLRKLGYTVEVHDNVHTAKASIERHLLAAN